MHGLQSPPMPCSASAVWHMPFFALWSNTEAELQHKQEQAEALQSAFSESQEIGAADREQRRALEDKVTRWRPAWCRCGGCCCQLGAQTEHQG